MKTKKTYTFTREIDGIELRYLGHQYHLDAVYEWEVTAWYIEGNCYGMPEDWTPDEDGYTVYNQQARQWSCTADGEPVDIDAVDLPGFIAAAKEAIRDAAWQMEHEAIWEEFHKN